VRFAAFDCDQDQAEASGPFGHTHAGLGLAAQYQKGLDSVSCRIATRRTYSFTRDIRYPAISLPKLDIVAVHKLYCRFRRCLVVSTVKVHGFGIMAVVPDDVGSIMRHVMHPSCWREYKTLSVTDKCRPER
jgi:hypothetical protein